MNDPNAPSLTSKMAALLRQHLETVSDQVFAIPVRLDGIGPTQVPACNATVNLRGRIVRDSMNIDMVKVLDLVRHRRYSFVVDFSRAQP